MTTEETIAFLEGHEDECFALAKQLANKISYENGAELNALRLMPLLEPLMADRRRLDWLMGASSWSALGHDHLTYRFIAPRPVDKAIKQQRERTAPQTTPVGR